MDQRAALAAMALPVAAALIGRHLLRTGRLTRRGTPPPDPPGTADLAYLAGGTWRVVLSAVAALRQAGAVDAAGGTLTVAGPPPTARPALESAIYKAAREGWRWPVSLHAAVAPLTAPLPRRLRRAGWVVATPGGTGSPERGCLVWLTGLLAVAWWIGTLLLAFSYLDPRSGPASLFALATGALALPIWALGHVPERTTVGERLLRAARERHRHITPTTPDEAALSVALWGGSALWALDPDFARRYRVARTGGTRADGGAWSAGGSPDGGADSPSADGD